MLKNITHVNLWVHDQDEALTFYTGKLELEVRDDVTVPEMGNYRWLTVGLPGQDGVAFVLNVPGPPVMDAEQLRAQGVESREGARRTLRRHHLRPARPRRQHSPSRRAPGGTAPGRDRGTEPLTRG